MNDEIEVIESNQVNNLDRLLASNVQFDITSKKDNIMLKKLLTLNTQFNVNNEDDDDDDDIICLDTVFKPKKNDISENVKVNLNTSTANSSFGFNSNTNFVGGFENDEIPIDDLISPPRNLDQGFNKEGSQKRLQDGNTDLNQYNTQTKKIKLIPPNTTGNSSHNKTQETCKHPIPPGSLLNIVILILQNTKCLTSRELWDYISGLFPFFENHFNAKQGVSKTRRILVTYKQYFLETQAKLSKSSKVKLVMLNPVMHNEIKVIINSMKAKKEEYSKSLYSPELFDHLINGYLKMSDVKLFHNRSITGNHDFPLNSEILSSSTLTTSPTVAGTNVANNFPLPIAEPTASTSSGTTTFSRSSAMETSLYEENLKDVNVLDLMDEEDKAEALSPKSTSSTETVVFDPKIVNCRTLNEDESESDILTINDLDEMESTSLPSESCRESSIIQNNFTDITDRISLNTENINSESAFANTVWSNEPEFTLNNMSNSPSNSIDESQTPIHSFPEIDKCIPKWKEIFPWMLWKPRKKTISCSLCEDIHVKVNTDVEVIIIKVFHADDVFSVSKLLRVHSEKYSHKMAYIISKKEIITILNYLASIHFSSFNSVSDIVNTFENILPGGVTNFNQDLLKCAIQMMGEYLEDKIMTKLIVLKKFSVIADPCAGLLVVRYVNDNDEPEEHLISSYSRVMDKNPLEYLSSLGISLKNMIIYVSNSRCEECQRCKASKKVVYKHLAPARLPILDRYLRYLWKSKVLRPFFCIGTTLMRLWMRYPHKFSEIGQLISKVRLSKFDSKPDVFLDLFQHFDKVKEIALSIYQLTGNLEALGLQNINVFQYEWLLDAFPTLTNINILLIEIKATFPFHRDFDNLFNVTEKFKLFCDKIKGSLREKRLKNLYIDASDIDDLYRLVEITVKEYQQPIYYKGRSLALSYQRITTLRNLEAYATDETVRNSFTVLYSSVRRNYRYEDSTLRVTLAAFLKEHPKCQKKDAFAVLQYLQEQKSPLGLDLFSGKAVHFFYRLMAYYPFIQAKAEKNIFEMKIYDYFFYRSAWAGIGPNIKEHLLTLMYELSEKSPLSERDIMKWWTKRDK